MKFNQVAWYSKLLAAILFIALPFLGFYVGIKYQQAITPKGSSSIINQTPKNGWKTVIQTNQITVRTKYENGVLKYEGTVQMPTPCHNLKDETVVLESYPEQVQIRLTIQKPKPDVVCAQVITPKEFSGEVKVSERAVVSVYLNGTRIK